jgi:hypothetical protein
MIPQKDILGITAVLITCSYKGKEFIRIGYYVNNSYTTEELSENPPSTVDITSVSRFILADKPRITKFPIDWEQVDDNIIPSIDGGFIAPSHVYNQMYNQARTDMMSKESIAQIF